MGLPPEPSKTGSFRKCHIYTIVINHSQLFEKKYSRNNNYLKQEKFNENMHTCFY